jgi:putative transposase
VRARTELGVHERTYRRWTTEGGGVGDRRPEAIRAAPSKKFTEQERTQTLALCHESEFASVPPSQIVTRLVAHHSRVAQP